MKVLSRIIEIILGCVLVVFGFFITVFMGMNMQDNTMSIYNMVINAFASGYGISMGTMLTADALGMVKE